MDNYATSAEHYSSTKGWELGNLDFYTIPQKWDEYTDIEHQTWQKLYKNQMEVLEGRAMKSFMPSLKALNINAHEIPRIEKINDILMEKTGWQAVCVPGLIPAEPFFELLANKRFPVGQFIRRPEQMDYIQEPDIFHDVFGHVPILADQTFADHVEAYGHGGLKAAKLGSVDLISRIYWHSVEFGLIKEDDELRIFGAGILSSPTECIFAIDSDSPTRIKFNSERILRTKYDIDDFQENYFVINDFQELFDATKPDFTPLYEKTKNSRTLKPGELHESDEILTKGTGEYAIGAKERRAERKRQKLNSKK